MQELLGILSIVSSLLVLALIWSTARPVRRTSRRARNRVAVTDAAPVQRWEQETVPVVDAGTTKAGSEEPRARAGNFDAPMTGAGEAAKGRAEGTERQQEPQEETAEHRGSHDGEAPPSEGVPGADPEEEVVRELSETLSMYRQLLEELRRFRSGGSSE